VESAPLQLGRPARVTLYIMSVHLAIEPVHVDDIPAPFRNFSGIYDFLDLRKSSPLSASLCNAAPLSTHTYLLEKDFAKLVELSDQHAWLADLVARVRADGFTTGTENQRLFYQFLDVTLNTLRIALLPPV
jgi:hypothetical protein